MTRLVIIFMCAVIGCMAAQNKAPSAAVAPPPDPVLPAPSLPATPSKPQDKGTYKKYTLPRNSNTARSATAIAAAKKNADASATRESSEECEYSHESEEDQCTKPNEEYALQPGSCLGEECFVITARMACPSTPPPPPGCYCKAGYYRLNARSPCVHICKCPQMASALECQNYVAKT